jgi:hypothetical protein
VSAGVQMDFAERLEWPIEQDMGEGGVMRLNTLDRVSGSTSHMALLAMLQRMRVRLEMQRCLLDYARMIVVLGT